MKCCLFVARPLTAVGLFLAVVFAPSSGGADGKPVLTMLGGTPGRNMVNTTDKKIPVEWNAQKGQQKNIKWVAELGKVTYGGPVIAGGKVYVGTNNDRPRNPKIKGDKGIVLCFRESDGQFLWQAVHDKLPNTQENDWPNQGVASTPAVDGNRVYYVSNRCELICADAEGFHDGQNDGVKDEKYTDKTDADIIWRLDMVKELGVYPRFLANCSPLVAGDHVFVVTGNGVGDDANGKHVVPAPKAPSFVAVHKTTGKVVWQSNAPGENIMEGQWSNPSYAEVNGKGQVIFPGGDGWLYAFEPATGKLIWKFDCNPKKSDYQAGGRGTRSYLMATPVVHDNKVYVGVGRNPDDGAGVGHLWCVDITKTGDLSPVNDNFDPKAPENKNSGLVWHYGGLVLPRPERGSEFVFGRTLSTCAVHDGLLYVAELAGYTHCVDAKTGQRQWVHDLKAGVWGSPYWVDGRVYLGTDSGDVWIYPHSKELKEKDVRRVEMERPINSTPVVANGVLYIMTDTQLYAIADK